MTPDRKELLLPPGVELIVSAEGARLQFPSEAHRQAWAVLVEGYTQLVKPDRRRAAEIMGISPRPGDRRQPLTADAQFLTPFAGYLEPLKFAVLCVLYAENREQPDPVLLLEELAIRTGVSTQTLRRLFRGWRKPEAYNTVDWRAFRYFLVKMGPDPRWKHGGNAPYQFHLRPLTAETLEGFQP